MPFHRIFAPKGFYSPTDKASFSESITKVYSFLPPFFVIVVFIDLPDGDLFVGGKLSKNQVRISVEHVARNFTNDADKRKFMERYEKAIQPFTKERGIEWEVQVVDCDVRESLPSSSVSNSCF
ncbi:putative oxalocrotonate tautomerase [Roridomyces roridus]|uniref:Oxalocrotonate tautomerase n=1 Tax=Roridomyces roridus TaxID=1738132 RepID=A0AAD7C046_9AGAR|nr:putative oxalocrotonate tautomerase [Roridomyces roridus]